MPRNFSPYFLNHPLDALQALLAVGGGGNNNDDST
jgi:hypothetical protein